jgi:hypothetical protein
VDDLDQYYSLQFGDTAKKHLHQILALYMSSEDSDEGSTNRELKIRVLVRLFEKTVKKLKAIGSTESAAAKKAGQ